MTSLDGTRENVRFIGVDTPEKGRPYYLEAMDFTARAIQTIKPVFLELDVGHRDRYGRLLAYVWLSRPLVGDDAEARASQLNAKLLLAGFAQVLTVPPNVKYADTFLRYQAEARNANRGLWGIEPSPEPSPTKQVTGDCHASYPDFCIPPPPPDKNCADFTQKNFTVRWDVSDPDPHKLDGNKDGEACEG